ncbi:MAG: peptidylprolyl isomerase [Candidatus Daviesbacteria bacterium]|nr:peptidylprolyl isomerase [Candidatus Daviesbacteria bacterium]
MTNQNLLKLLLIVFIIGAAAYFVFNKFKQEISISPSPTPTPGNINFTFNQPQQSPSPTIQPQPSGLPFAKNKSVGTFPGILKEEFLKNKKAQVSTNKGMFELEIYADAPMTASNFIFLAANGFYDGLNFHRVEKGFVIQGGDPLGNGTGGPGYIFPNEAVTRDYNKGVVAMANAGPNTNGSQFFVLLEDRPELPKNYTIFAKVIVGMDVVEKIEVGDTMKKITVQNLQ